MQAVRIGAGAGSKVFSRAVVALCLLASLLTAGAMTAPGAQAAGGQVYGPFAGKPYASVMGKAGLNGNVVVYASWLLNFEPKPVPIRPDLGIYYRDRVAGQTGSVVNGLGGALPDGTSYPLAVSPDAATNYVLHRSVASNLVSGDTLGHDDIFVAHRVTGVSERVSIANDEAEANGPSNFAAMSGNTATGEPRYIAFTSAATNLVAGDTNGRTDVFVRDRQGGTTDKVTVGVGGAQANGDSGGVAISDNGRYVAFASTASNLVANDTNGVPDVFVRDRQAGTTTRVSVGHLGQASGASGVPSISFDGRFVSFDSDADDIVAGDENIGTDVFVHDRVSGSTERVSVGTNGQEGFGDSANPSMSRNGRFIAFETDVEEFSSIDTNLEYDVYVRDRLGRVTQRASERSNDGEAFFGVSTSASISPDGRWVAFDIDTEELSCGEGCDSNDDYDVYLKDMGSAFVSNPTGSKYRAITPVRVYDTTAGAKLAAGATPEVQVTGGSTTVPASATAVMLNVRTSGTTSSGAALTVYPSGTTRPSTALLHPQVGIDVANQGVVKVGTNGNIRLYTNTGATNVVVDVVGYYAPDNGDGFSAVTAAPILDTRGALVPTGWPAAMPLVSNGSFARLDLPVAGTADVPATARAVALTIASEGIPANATITAFPTGAANPGTPNIVLPSSGYVTNTVVVPVGSGGRVSFAIKSGAAHLVVSVAGYFGPGASDVFFPLNPARAFDTRSGSASLAVPELSGPVPAAGSVALPLAGRAGIPSDARAASVATSSTSIGTPGVLILHPNEGPMAFRANLTYWSTTVSAGNLLQLGQGGAVRGINYAASSVHLFADAYGYFR